MKKLFGGGIKFLQELFSDRNEICENTVYGSVCLGILISLLYIPEVAEFKVYTMAGLVAGFFCLNLPKK